MIFQPVSADEQPVIELYYWSIRSAVDENGERSSHFVGIANGCGRVSSPIVDWASSREALTSSGRIYKLIGMEGYNPDSEYVWNRWLQINECEEVEY